MSQTYLQYLYLGQVPEDVIGEIIKFVVSHPPTKHTYILAVQIIQLATT